MKTIIVVYTNKESLSDKEIRMARKYAFNTESDVSVGDRIESSDYNTNILVVRILKRSYKYYNQNTGRLSIYTNKYMSTAQNEIVKIVISESKDENVVYGHKLV